MIYRGEERKDFRQVLSIENREEAKNIFNYVRLHDKDETNDKDEKTALGSVIKLNIWEKILYIHYIVHAVLDITY